MARRPFPEAQGSLRTRAVGAIQSWLHQGFPSIMRPVKNTLGFIAMVSTLAAATNTTEPLRVGMIGLDTSHVIAFTEILNNPTAKDHVPGARVVAAFRGGSPDLESSRNRLEGYTRELQQKYHVTLYDSIDALCRNVDAVLLESVDGRPHLAQAIPVILARRPLFIDKPMAGSLRDVLAIFRLAQEYNVPVFSASALRFATNTQAARHGSIGRVQYAQTSSPCEIHATHPDLFWYGIHGVESLFTVLGTGCESVRRTTTNNLIEVTGQWSGNRTGVYRQGKSYSGVARGERGDTPVGAFDGYAPLVREIVRFFKTRQPPVPPEETIELFAFMEAADESKRLEGAEVRIHDILRSCGYPAADRP